MSKHLMYNQNKSNLKTMVTIYSKDYCPYCVKAKALLNSLNVEYTDIDVSNDQEKLMEISAKSGLQTVPQIFVGEKCLGGFTDIEALNNEGKLLELLK